MTTENANEEAIKDIAERYPDLFAAMTAKSLKGLLTTDPQYGWDHVHAMWHRIQQYLEAILEEDDSLFQLQHDVLFFHSYVKCAGNLDAMIKDLLEDNPLPRSLVEGIMDYVAAPAVNPYRARKACDQ